MKDDIEAPWVGEPGIDESEVVSQEDYDFYWQDDVRKDEEILSVLALANE